MQRMAFRVVETYRVCCRGRKFSTQFILLTSLFEITVPKVRQCIQTALGFSPKTDEQKIDDHVLAGLMLGILVGVG